jgi:hypothetical protein
MLLLHTSSPFLTDKEEVLLLLLQNLTFFFSFFEKQRTCVHDPTPEKASQPASQPAFFDCVFSLWSNQKKVQGRKEKGG